MQSVFRKNSYVISSLSYFHVLHCHSFVPDREVSQYHIIFFFYFFQILSSQVHVEENYLV